MTDGHDDTLAAPDPALALVGYGEGLALPSGARPVSEVPEDGTWGVLWPGYYGSFISIVEDGQWALAEESDLSEATHWLPDPFAGCGRPTSTLQGVRG